MTERMKNKIETECKESCHPAVFETAIDWYLKNLWHNASEEPQMFREYLLIDPEGRIFGSWGRNDESIPWEYIVKQLEIFKWCYADDLIPDTFQKLSNNDKI